LVGVKPIADPGVASKEASYCAAQKETMVKSIGRAPRDRPITDTAQPAFIERFTLNLSEPNRWKRFDRGHDGESVMTVLASADWEVREQISENSFQELDPGCRNFILLQAGARDNVKTAAKSGLALDGLPR
jgi:hypothetical protein